MQTNPQHCEEETQNTNGNVIPKDDFKTAISSLFLSEMIAKLVRTQGIAYQNKDPNQDSSNKQYVNNDRCTISFYLIGFSYTDWLN